MDSGQINCWEDGVSWGLTPTRTPERSAIKGDEPRLKTLIGGSACSYEPPGGGPEEGEAEADAPLRVLLGLGGGPTNEAAPRFEEPPDCAAIRGDGVVGPTQPVFRAPTSGDDDRSSSNRRPDRGKLVRRSSWDRPDV